MGIPSTAQTVDEVARRIATELGLPVEDRDEAGLLRWSNQRVADTVRKLGSPVADLEQLRSVVAGELGLLIKEVREDSDIDRIEKEQGDGRDSAVAQVRGTLDQQTEGILLRRQFREDWERPFLAVVDARGSRAARAYFSGWHEIAHLLTSNRQRQFEFQFRSTRVVRREPEEVLMDKIAGELGYYRPMVEPVLTKAIGARGTLGFQAVEQMRAALAPSASKHSAYIGAVNAAPFPAIYLKAAMGRKAHQERIAHEVSLFGGAPMANLVEEKLRAREVTHNDASREMGVELFPNMEIPAESLVAKAVASGAASGHEDLGTWRTSRGALKSVQVFIEAKRLGDATFALLTVV